MAMGEPRSTPSPQGDSGLELNPSNGKLSLNQYNSTDISKEVSDGSFDPDISGRSGDHAGSLEAPCDRFARAGVLRPTEAPGGTAMKLRHLVLVLLGGYLAKIIRRALIEDTEYFAHYPFPDRFAAQA